MVNKNKLKKYTYKTHDGKIKGYYIAYSSLYCDTIAETESKAIKNALKKIGGFDHIYELRFHLDTKKFDFKTAFYKDVIGEIDNYNRDKPIYKTVLAGRWHKEYLLSKDGKKIKVIR